MPKKTYIDIEVDKLTNSIENTLTGEVFETIITQLKPTDSRQIKKIDWQFNWQKEVKDDDKEVYQLATVTNPGVVQGLVSIQYKDDHIFMHLIENAKFNKGKTQVYFGVPGNLVAFVCKLSFDKGFGGFLAFDAKTALIAHYEKTLGATHFRGKRMIIETNAAIKLVNRYFNKLISMGLIREPKNVDFSMQSEPWSKEELKELSEYIKKRKAAYLASEKRRAKEKRQSPLERVCSLAF